MTIFIDDSILTRVISVMSYRCYLQVIYGFYFYFFVTTYSATAMRASGIVVVALLALCLLTRAQAGGDGGEEEEDFGVPVDGPLGEGNIPPVVSESNRTTTQAPSSGDGDP